MAQRSKAETSEGATGEHACGGDNGIERFVLEAVAQLLPQAPPSATSLLTKSLSQLGVASIGAIALQYRIDAAFQVLVPVADLLSDRSLAVLVEHVRSSRAESARASPALSEVRL
jgi:hypothetical protein